MDNYDDETFEDGFNEDRSAEGMQMHLWRRLFPYVSRYRREMYILMAAAAATAMMEPAYPLLTKWIIDDVQENGMEANFVLWGSLGLFVNVSIAVAVGTFVWAAGKLRVYACHDLREDAFANLQKLSFSYYDYRPVGWLMARMTSDCDRLTNILAWAFLDLIWGTTMMLTIAIAMFVMNWKLAIVALIITPLAAWVSAKFRRRILVSARKVRATNSRITGSYNEGIMGVLTSKAFVREQDNQGEFGSTTGTMYSASVKNFKLAAIYLPIILVMAAISSNLTLFVGGSQMYMGLVGAGTVIAFMMLAQHFFDPVETMGHWFAEMQMAQASAERVLSLIDAEPDIQDSGSVLAAIAAQQGAPARQNIAFDGGSANIENIELKGVGFYYDSEKPVLHDINLTARMGETIAIVGPTGGGKSTLVNVICRFYEPTQGQVLIDGVDYRARSLHWLQSNIGMVLQNAHVFSGSIRDNIRYGNLSASDAEIEAAAKLAGAHDFITALEQGYDTVAGEGASRLSAGQKQLVSFARAILADPRILVMDEATSSVDTETELTIQRGLARLLEGRINFVIAHRLSTIRNATRIVVIEDGRITELGTHRELMAARGHYADLYRQQGLNETTAEEWGLTPSPAPGG